MRMTLSAATTAALTLCLTSSPALAALDDGVLGDLLNAGKPDTSTQANPDGADRAAAEDEAAPSSAALPGNETTASASTNVPAHIGGRFSEPFSEPTLVVDGKVQVYRKSGNEEVVLATLGRGDILGEMSLIDNQPRMASARVVGNAKLTVITQDDLAARLGKLGDSDKVLRRLIDVFVDRLRGQGRFLD